MTLLNITQTNIIILNVRYRSIGMFKLTALWIGSYLVGRNQYALQASTFHAQIDEAFSLELCIHIPLVPVMRTNPPFFFAITH